MPRVAAPLHSHVGVCGCPVWWAQGKATPMCQLPLPYLNNCIRMMQQAVDEQYVSAASGLRSNELRKLLSTAGEQELKLNQLLSERERRRHTP